MSEQLPEENNRPISESFERDSQIQSAFDQLLTLGSQLSFMPVASKEMAEEVCYKLRQHLDEKYGEDSSILARRLWVSGSSVRLVNFKHELKHDGQLVGYKVTVDNEEPTRQLESFEKRLFDIEAVTVFTDYSPDTDLWHVGLKLDGRDPEGTVVTVIADDKDEPLLTNRVEPTMSVICDSAAWVEVPALVEAQERSDALAQLRGRVSGGIIRLLRAVDHEMTYGELPNATCQLERVQNLRILARHSAQLTNEQSADALNTAIAKVLGRRAGVVVGGSLYANDSTHEATSLHGIVHGIVADIITTLPIAPSFDVGPTLVLMSPRDPNEMIYAPLKDLQTLQY